MTTMSNEATEVEQLKRLAQQRGVTLNALLNELHTLASTLGDASREPPQGSRSRLIDQDNRYRDQGLFAQGGMGEIRQVFDTRLNRCAVMKVVHPELSKSNAARRLHVDVDITGQLQHSGVVPVYDS